MPTYIPYEHPSLTLGRVVDDAVLKVMSEMRSFQQKSDAAFDKMMSLMDMYRSLKLTITELEGMEIPTPEMGTRLTELDAAIKQAAQDYITLRLSNDKEIQAKRTALADIDVDDTLDSPVNFVDSKIVNQPVGSDSMRLDMQYFSYGATSEENDAKMTEISNAIREMTSDLGAKSSSEVARTASKQIGQQLKSHDLNGTLVIAATCTHRNAAMLVPLELDADRLLEIWNQRHGEDSLIDTSDLSAMKRIAQSVEGGKSGLAGSIPLLVGINLGSCFVGMVHTVDHDEFETNRSAEDIIGMEDKVRLGNWLSAMNGEIGMDQAVREEINDLLGHRKVYAHVNLITQGVVPSFVAGAAQDAAKKMVDNQANRGQSNLKAAGQSGPAKQDTEATAAQSARMLAQVANLDGKMTEDLIAGLGKLDAVSNKALDINSMMIAFDNYIKTINDDKKDKVTPGVPIGYHVRRISAAKVARLWLDKYFPEFSPRSSKAASAAGTTTGAAGGPARKV